MIKVLRRCRPLVPAVAATGLSAAGALFWVAELWSASIVTWAASLYHWGIASLTIARQIHIRKGRSRA